MQIAQKPQRTRGIRRKLLGLALLPATLLAYSPPNTVVYVTREGVFAGAPTGS